MKLRWRFGIIAGLFLAIFCSYPQLKMWYELGPDWNGHYAYNDIDEVAYASYVRALIDGRPRRNDPYTGRDHTEETPQPESLFSIQFAAPYTLAIPARILGIGTPWAMTLSGAIAGFLSALAVFWFIGRMTDDDWFAMAAGLGVFCFGTLAAGEGAILEVLYDGFSYPYFPGFRRYIPAMSLPAFFAFVGIIWVLVSRTPEDDDDPEAARPPILHVPNPRLVLAAVACFAYTVYSYFYVWTTAAAFLACVFLMWLVCRPAGWGQALRNLIAVAAGCLIALVPYAYLLSQRAETMDHVQLLVYTRLPDLARFPLYVALAVIVAIAGGIVMKRLDLRDRPVLFALALAAVPFILFNQQIITGRSLQPIHYQVFIGNYVAALSVFVGVAVLRRTRREQGTGLPRLASVIVFIAAGFWGLVECHYTVRVLDWANAHRDAALPLAGRLEELALDSPDRYRQTVLSYDGIFADDLPSVAPQAVLWARHQHVFAGLSWEESKERYYQQLYYSNIEPKRLEQLLRKDFVSQIALFGWGRHTDRLSSEAKPLTYAEIGDEVRLYEEYIAGFGIREATDPLISYVVVENSEAADLSRLLLWYELDEGEIIGRHTLYRARLRPGN